MNVEFELYQATVIRDLRKSLARELKRYYSIKYADCIAREWLVLILTGSINASESQNMLKTRAEYDWYFDVLFSFLPARKQKVRRALVSQLDRAEARLDKFRSRKDVQVELQESGDNIVLRADRQSVSIQRDELEQLLERADYDGLSSYGDPDEVVLRLIFCLVTRYLLFEHELERVQFEPTDAITICGNAFTPGDYAGFFPYFERFVGGMSYSALVPPLLNEFQVYNLTYSQVIGLVLVDKAQETRENTSARIILACPANYPPVQNINAKQTICTADNSSEHIGECSSSEHTKKCSSAEHIGECYIEL